MKGGSLQTVGSGLPKEFQLEVSHACASKLQQGIERAAINFRAATLTYLTCRGSWPDMSSTQSTQCRLAIKLLRCCCQTLPKSLLLDRFMVLLQVPQRLRTAQPPRGAGSGRRGVQTNVRLSVKGRWGSLPMKQLTGFEAAFTDKAEFCFQGPWSPRTCSCTLLYLTFACACRWSRLSLGYTESDGHPVLRQEIANLYESVTPKDVIVMVPQEAIQIAARWDANLHSQHS